MPKNHVPETPSGVIQLNSITTGSALTGALTGDDVPLLLMLHGVTRRWQTFVPLMSSLGARWQISAFDFRGHGQSNRVSGKYRVCDYLDDAIALLDSQTDRPIVLYGHSLGAMVAAGVAARQPDRIAAVILEDPPLQTMGDRIDQTSLLSLFIAMRMFAGDSRGVAEIATELGDSQIYDPATGITARLGDLRDAVSLRFTASCLQQLDSSVLDPVVRGEWMDGYETESIFRSLECPCLLLQADPTAGGMLIDEDAQSLETWARKLVRVKLNDCGHVIHWNQTLSLLNYVHGFLESSMINY